MFKPNTTDTKPCWHMRTLVSSFADNQLSGLQRWFTEAHLAGCPQCQHGLATLRALRTRLGQSKVFVTAPESLTPPHWSAIEAAWEQADLENADTSV